MSSFRQLASKITGRSDTLLASWEQEYTRKFGISQDYADNFFGVLSSLYLLRRMRGRLCEKYDDNSLTQSDIDINCTLSAKIGTNAGHLLWQPSFTSPDECVRDLEDSLAEGYALAGHHRPFSIYYDSSILDTWFFYPQHYSLHKNEDLGVCFSIESNDGYLSEIPHRYLSGIHVSRLKSYCSSGPIVFAAAASSGVIEAGIVASYLGHVHDISAEIYPLFFSDSQDISQLMMHSTLPSEYSVVIPFDDSKIGSGYSSAKIVRGVLQKYPHERILPSDFIKNGVWNHFKKK